MVEGLYEAFREDIEQKRELSFLKKIDQEENLVRAKNFYVIILTKTNYFRTCTGRSWLRRLRTR